MLSLGMHFFKKKKIIELKYEIFFIKKYYIDVCVGSQSSRL